jgi:hypothetical protein
MRQKRQTVLGKSQMTHLPCNVADTAWRLSKPLRCWCLIEKPNGVVAGKDDLLNGKLQAGHGLPFWLSDFLGVLGQFFPYRYFLSGRSQNPCDDQRSVVVCWVAVGEIFHGTQNRFKQGRGLE